MNEIKDSDAEELLHKSDINNYSHSVPPSENCDEKHATYNTLKIRVQDHAFMGILVTGFLAKFSTKLERVSVETF